MDEIKIGDYVQPTSKLRQKQFGVGIVTRIYPKNKYSLLVVFPSAEGVFNWWQFTELGLIKVKVSIDKKRDIMEAQERWLAVNDALILI